MITLSKEHNPNYLAKVVLDKFYNISYYKTIFGTKVIKSIY